MPKKADGTGHRGFAFLDFNTKQEAMAALENLKDVHLYEKHLIVQPREKGRNVEAALG
jgi:multiple RNA-binding domain-containing protein 1